VRRIWNQIQKLEPVPNPRKHAATKADQILALLRQPSGATLQSITKATGWQAHSVRGFISGHLVKKMGLRVKSFRRDGERVYAIKSWFGYQHVVASADYRSCRESLDFSVIGVTRNQDISLVGGICGAPLPLQWRPEARLAPSANPLRDSAPPGS
jgi:hypothetical protein